jgi:hypothetical protein
VEMRAIAEWCNQNQGAAILLLTFVYVIATLVMVVLMWWANRISKRNIEMALMLERQRMRPHLIFDLESRDRMMYAVIKNIGLTPARDVAIDVFPKLEHTANLPDKECSLTRHSISFVAPSREFTDVIDSAHNFFKRYTDPIFRGTVRYKGSDTTEYSEPFIIDMRFAATILRVQKPPDPGQELKKIRELLHQKFKS